MIRGEVWRAVYSDAEHDVAARLPELMKTASHRWGAMRWPADAIPPGGVRPETVAYISEDSGEIRHLFVVMTGRTIGPSRVGAAYPFVPHGTAHEVEIGDIYPYETGIGGEVTARIGGTVFRFFEPLWGVRRKDYRPGSVQRVRFAAFGHGLQAMGANAHPAPAAAQSALIMIGPGATSRYGMCAPIVDWRGFWVGERLYYALTLRLAESEGRELTVELYAGRHAFKGDFTPAPGIALAGVIWLHGTLAV